MLTNKIAKFLMKLVMPIVIKLKLYRIFWSLIGLLFPRKGAAWLATVNHEKWGAEDAAYILRTAQKYGASLGVVMDYGCGYGRVAKHLAPHVERLICADVSPTYLARAKRWLKEYSNVGYLLVNGKDLKQLPDSSIDIVYSIGVFVHINRKDAILLSLEVARVLKTGGLFIVDLPNPDANWPSFEKYSHQDIEEFVKPYQVLEQYVSETITRLVLKKV